MSFEGVADNIYPILPRRRPQGILQTWQRPLFHPSGLSETSGTDKLSQLFIRRLYIDGSRTFGLRIEVSVGRH